MVLKETIEKVENYIKKKKEVELQDLRNEFRTLNGKVIREILDKLNEDNKIVEISIKVESENRNRSYKRKLIKWKKR